jgi:hypothetical protein
MLLALDGDEGCFDATDHSGSIIVRIRRETKKRRVILQWRSFPPSFRPPNSFDSVAAQMQFSTDANK